ncbi:predicted protein [Nematostella vectensis]|uniref:Apple domain-containing protein n=2 Tax=Nematostella vectensis TaxID=45351 RepID=A7SRX5_NEMVE|nr:predicted protein [Nematostella vectensis]|eukprot:XP_001625657.1 predicted protein [Nematostella vectensis]
MQTEYGTYLKGHVMEERPGIGVDSCTSGCLDHADCRSINFDRATHMCELNNASKEDFPEHVTRNHRSLYATNDFHEEPIFEESCAYWLKRYPDLKTRYYWIKTKNKRKKMKVYCDMERFGGGWTLVVTINAKNNEHLQKAENNCADSVTCVTFTETDIPGRKLSDEDIHEIAGNEGVFQVKVPFNSLSIRAVYKNATVFYKIPSGAQNFDSSCLGKDDNCPRIIVSFAYRTSGSPIHAMILLLATRYILENIAVSILMMTQNAAKRGPQAEAQTAVFFMASITTWIQVYILEHAKAIFG